MPDWVVSSREGRKRAVERSVHQHDEAGSQNAMVGRPDTWMQDDNYLVLLNFVQNLTVVNDPSERIVQLAEKRIKTVKSEGRFQDTLLTVHELSLLSRGFKRDRSSKLELQTIISKLMAA